MAPVHARPVAPPPMPFAEPAPQPSSLRPLAIILGVLVLLGAGVAGGIHLARRDTSKQMAKRVTQSSPATLADPATQPVVTTESGVRPPTTTRS